MVNETSNSELINKTIRGTMWVYLSTYGAKGIVFISTIVLSRLLMPGDFGMAGYALVTLALLETLEGLGIHQALIYHRKYPERTNTAFWLGLGIGLGLCVILLLIAPLMGWFFKEGRTVGMVRLLALTVPISSLGLVHNALMHKELAFKNRFVVEISKSLSKAIFSITLAATGFGVWSLIYGHIIGVAICVIALWKLIPWRPSLRFDKSHISPLLSYGTKIVSSRSLNIFCQNLDYLLIGRFIGATALGIYIVAFRTPELFIGRLSNGLTNALFPAFAKLRDNVQALKRGFLLTTKYVNMITIPLGLGLALVAEPFVRVFFTVRWIDAVPISRAIALSFILRIMISNIGTLCNAQGRPGLVAKINLGHTLLTLPALIWAAAVVGSLSTVAWTHCALALVLLGIRLYVAVRVLNISFGSIVETLHLTIIGGTFMAVAVTAALHICATTPPIIQLLVSSLIGGLVYISTLWVLQHRAMIEASQALRAAVRQN